METMEVVVSPVDRLKWKAPQSPSSIQSTPSSEYSGNAENPSHRKMMLFSACFPWKNAEKNSMLYHPQNHWLKLRQSNVAMENPRTKCRFRLLGKSSNSMDCPLLSLITICIPPQLQWRSGAGVWSGATKNSQTVAVSPCFFEAGWPSIPKAWH